MHLSAPDKFDLYRADCLDILPTLPVESVDLVVTSPPYDNLRVYKNTLEWGPDTWKALIAGLYRVVKPGGVIVWVVADGTKNGSESGTSFRQALYAMECGFNLHDTMIYEKSGMSYPDSTRYHQIHEFMFVFSKGKPQTFNPIKDRKNKFVGAHGGNKRGGLCVRGGYGSRFNIWRYANGRDNSSKDRLAFEHPAIFPEQLAADHIRTWSNPGDVVLDPLAGSGTTGKMALLADRKFIGIEKVPEYFNIAYIRCCHALTLDNP